MVMEVELDCCPLLDFCGHMVGGEASLSMPSVWTK